MTRRVLKVYNALDLNYTPADDNDAARKVDVDAKADKPSESIAGNLAALDGSGNLTDAGTSAGAINTTIDNHVNATTAHGSTATPTAERIAEYNSAGNLQSGSPTEDGEVTTRGFIAEIFRTIKINVRARTGAVVTLTNRDYTTTLNADAQGYVNLETERQGDWTITATYKGLKVAETTITTYLYNSYDVDLGIPQDFVLFGVRHYVNESSPALTRLGDSAEFTFTPETASQFGASDFDDQPIYKDLRRCVVNLNGNDLAVTYDDDPNYTTTPETGDVCVEIPLFYYWRDGSHLNDATPYEDLYISDKQATPNFLPSPAHMDRGDGAGVRDVVYIGAYQSNADFRSVAEATAKQDTLANNRAGYLARSSKYHQMDIASHATILLLYMVEVANLDALAAVSKNAGYAMTYVNITGGSDEMVYCSGVAPHYQIYRTSDYLPANYDAATTYSAGDLVQYGGGFWRALDTTTGNAPTEGDYWTNYEEEYDTAKSYQVGDCCEHNGYLYQCRTATSGGAWDSLKWTGQNVAKSNLYRGFENLWGRLTTALDGVLCKGSDIYISINPANYSSSSVDNYTKVGYSFAGTGYIKRVGYDPALPFVFYATEVGGSSSTFFADYSYGSLSWSFTGSVFGGTGYGNIDGIFCNLSHNVISTYNCPSRVMILK